MPADLTRRRLTHGELAALTNRELRALAHAWGYPLERLGDHIHPAVVREEFRLLQDADRLLEGG